MSYSTKDRGSGIPMVNMREIFAFDRISDQECELAPLTVSELRSSLLESGDLLFARQSLSYEGAGKCVLVLPAKGPRTWESHLIRVRLNPSLASPGYFYYYFRSPAGRRLIETIIQQVAAAGIRGSDLGRLLVPIPTIEDQRSIAEVLGSLDDKIEANSILATTADALVRARFAALASHDKRSIGDLYDIRRESADPTALLPDAVYVGLEHIPRRNIWPNDFGTAADVTSGKSSFMAGDVLFGKLRPYFHKIVSVGVSGICSTDVLVLRPKNSDLSGYALAAVASDAVVHAVTAASGGTRMPRTSWRDLAVIQIPWPGQASAHQFSIEVRALEKSVQTFVAENRTLAAIRDALLPQLMSGKLRVRDAEKSLAGVL